MAYDEQLAKRIETILNNGETPEAISKKMFGGVCFLIHGNMVCGVHKDNLIARVGPDAYDAALKKKGAKVFDLTGRPMKGWVEVAPKALTDKALAGWIDNCVAFVLSLPPK